MLPYWSSMLTNGPEERKIEDNDMSVASGPADGALEMHTNWIRLRKKLC